MPDSQHATPSARSSKDAVPPLTPKSDTVVGSQAPVLNLGLNDGTYAPQAVVDAVLRFNNRCAFRNYTAANHDALRSCIAQQDGVRADNVFLHNGTGPILKLAIPQLVKSKIFSSPLRIARHILKRNGYPLYTPRWTYSKIPRKATESGLHVHYLPLSPEQGFRLDLGEVRKVLRSCPGVVYLVNPNNPTGNVLFERDEILPLIQEFPESTFWIDEAYVEYLEDSHARCSDLVRNHHNVFVSRSFSFAYGMAGLRIGYLLAPTPFVRELESKVTDYRLGSLQETAALAALQDTEHLPDLRKKCHEARELIRRGLAPFAQIECFPSEVNYIFCRFRDGRAASSLAKALRERGILIKTFEPYGGFDSSPYFRLTIGLPDENERLIRAIADALGAAT